MQTIFIEENLNRQQILNLCSFIDSNQCHSLEFRRCTIADFDFDALTHSLANNASSLISLIFNIQMIDEPTRFKKFLQILVHSSNLLHLQVHGNNIDDEMFSRMYSTLHEHCPRLNLLDIGDNKLTNRSIVHLCSLILSDEKRTGLEELTVSANRSISNAGWTELFFAISFNSRLRRLTLDYNVLDETMIAMLSMIVASSRTLTQLDLECCNLTEYAGQLFLRLFTKYPVHLEEICLDKNPLIPDATRALIKDCLELKSRRNSTSMERMGSGRSPVRNDPMARDSSRKENVHTDRTTAMVAQPSPKKPSLRYRDARTNYDRSDPVRASKKSVEIKERYEEPDVEELLPVDIEPYGTVGPTPYLRRVY